MYEYHGWINIKPSASEIDDEHREFAKIIPKVSKLIEDFQSDGRIVDFRVMNANYVVCVAGFNNHEYPGAESLLKLFHTIGVYAPGSYGILYARNDEDMKGFENEFQVWRLVRGEFEKMKDHYLSPCVPVIEDA